MNNQARIKSNRAIRQAKGIFKSEGIYISPEFLEEIMREYNIQNKDKQMILVLRKGNKNGKKQNV